MNYIMSDNNFNELRTKALEIWQTYDDSYGYVSEKVEKLNSLENYSDNYGAIIGMFDHNNQKKLYDTVNDELKSVIDEWVGGLDRVLALAKEMGL